MKKYFLISLILIVIALALGFYFSIILEKKENILPKGLYIGKVSVGGLSVDEAIKVLETFEASTDDIEVSPLMFVFHDDGKIINYQFLPSQIGAAIDPVKTINSVVSELSGEKIFLRKIFNLNKRKNIFFPYYKIESEEEALVFLKKIKKLVDRQPIEATFVIKQDYETSEAEVSIKKEVVGKKLLINDSYEILKKGIEEGKRSFVLSVESIVPKVTEEMLKAIPNPKVIGSFTTYFGKYDSKPRVHNIRIASSFIDNYYLGTDETFSLVEVMGNFSEEKGYQDAYVIVGEELVPELGGGACQVATTLYNAVMLADLEVLFRRNHGIYFSIYPLGRDAVIYPPYLDLKFKNNTGAPVLIKVTNYKKGINISIIGKETNKKVKFSSPRVQYKQTTITTKDAETGEIFETVIKTNAFKTEVIKTVFQNGKQVSKETIRSFYKLHGDRVEVKKRDKKEKSKPNR